MTNIEFIDSCSIRIEDTDFELMQIGIDHFKGYSIHHQHYSYEIHYVHDGELKITANNTEYELHAGDMLIIPSNVYHDVLADESSTLLCFEFYGSKNNITPLKSVFNLINQLPNERCVTLRADNALSAVADDLLAPGGDRKLKLMTFIYCCLMFVCRYLDSGNDKYIKSSVTPRLATEKEILLIDLADNYLHKYMNKPTLEGMAQYLGLTRRQTEYLLLKAYGMTFSRKLTEIRMINAASLLRKKKHTITEIAKLTGYNSEQGLYAAFRKYYHVSPSEYIASLPNDI